MAYPALGNLQHSPKPYRFTLTIPACVRTSATGLVDPAVSGSSSPSARRTIMCMLLIARMALVWNLLGQMKRSRQLGRPTGDKMTDVPWWGHWRR